MLKMFTNRVKFTNIACQFDAMMRSLNTAIWNVSYFLSLSQIILADASKSCLNLRLLRERNNMQLKTCENIGSSNKDTAHTELVTQEVYINE